ncbi:MAG: hypothetical protein KAS32_29320 [Candidatus Peribacteraceae bacterium]|nr:hypothetical protein [Candidatus Peribacteraceae bacterium]
MKYIKRILLLFVMTLIGGCVFYGFCSEDDPYVEETVDIQNMEDAYSFTLHQGDTPRIRFFLKRNGENWQPDATWGGQLGYGTNEEWSTNMVIVDGTVNTLTNFIDFQFGSADGNTNGTFFSQLILTNTAGRRYLYALGNITLLRNPMRLSSSPLVLQNLPTGVGRGDMTYYSTSASSWVRFGIGNNNDRLIVSNGIPSWQSSGPGNTNNITNLVEGFGIDIDGSGPERTITHEDTSSQSSVTNTAGNVIQSIDLDSRGHNANITSFDLDDRYYTETEADGLFFSQTDGETGSNALNVLEAKYDTTSNNLDTVSNDLDIIEASYAITSNTVDDVQLQVTSNDSDIAGLVVDLSTVSNDVDTLEAKYDVTSNTVDDLQLQITSNDSDIAGIIVDLSTVSNDLDSLELSFGIVSNRVDSNAVWIVNTSNDVNQLELGVTIISNDLDTLESKYDVTSNTVDDLQLQISSNDTDIATLQARSNAVEVAVDFSPTNYSAAAQNVEEHLKGIDTNFVTKVNTNDAISPTNSPIAGFSGLQADNSGGTTNFRYTTNWLGSLQGEQPSDFHDASQLTGIINDSRTSTNIPKKNEVNFYNNTNNYSEGRIFGSDPAETNELATKDYVDEQTANANILEWLWGSTAAQSPTNYYVMTNSVGNAALRATNVIPSSITNDQYVISFITCTNCITRIPGGTVVNVHYHADIDGTGSPALSLKPELYERESDGTETNEILAGSITAINTTETIVSDTISISDDFVLQDGSSLVLKLKASGLNGNVSLNFITEGDTQARLELPGDTGSFYRKSGDTLEGDMNGGAFNGVNFADGVESQDLATVHQVSRDIYSITQDFNHAGTTTDVPVTGFDFDNFTVTRMRMHPTNDVAFSVTNVTVRSFGSSNYTAQSMQYNWWEQATWLTVAVSSNATNTSTLALDDVTDFVTDPPDGLWVKSSPSNSYNEITAVGEGFVNLYEVISVSAGDYVSVFEQFGFEYENEDLVNEMYLRFITTAAVTNNIRLIIDYK